MNHITQVRPTIFISHANEDADYASAIRSWLDEALLGAINFFVSTDRTSIPLGAEWPQRIREALEDSCIVLVIVSPVSVERRWLYFEAGAGYVRGIPVIPVCVAGMQRNDLLPPFSLLQSIQFPNRGSEKRLIDLAAENAGLRPPTRVTDLVLPERISAVAVPATAPSDSSDLNNPPTRSEARKILKSADPTDLAYLRDLLKEALLVIEIPTWSGNRSDAKNVLRQLKILLKKPVLLSKEETEQMFTDAAQEYKEWQRPKKAQMACGTDLNDYDWARCVIHTVQAHMPSPAQYEDQIFTYPSELYGPLLLTEIRASEQRSSRWWNLVRLLTNSELDRWTLPFLSGIIASHEFGSWDFKRATQMARSILLNEFGDWYRRIRGRPLIDDLQREEEKKEREEARQAREYEMRALFEQQRRAQR